MTQPVCFNGRRVAVATLDGGVLIGQVAKLDPSDPERRFITAMVRYAVASARGELPEAYADAHAELFARTLLMPDIEFDDRRLDTDEELAARFVVPVEQVVEKHGDLVTWWDRPPTLQAVLA